MQPSPPHIYTQLLDSTQRLILNSLNLRFFITTINQISRVLSNEQLSEGSRLPNTNVAKDWKWEIKHCHNSMMTVHVARLRYRFLNLKHRTPFPKSTSTVHAMLTASRVCYLLALGEFQIGLCRPIWNMIRLRYKEAILQISCKISSLHCYRRIH